MENTAKKSVFLIGEVTPLLPLGAPTIRDTLKVYFNHRLIFLRSKKESISSIATELMTHFQNSKIETIAKQEIVRKVFAIIDKYDTYKKTMYRDTDTQRRNEQKFVDLLNTQFDIVPKQNYHRNKNIPKKIEEAETLQLCDENSNTSDSVALGRRKVAVNVAQDCPFDDDNVEISNNTDDPDFETSLSKYQRSKFSITPAADEPGVIQKIINSPDVSSVLDRIGLSPPKFMLLCTAIAGEIGEDLNSCVLSTSTCYRRRKSHRNEIVTTIKDEFISTLTSNLVVHWDGKKLPDSTNDDIALRKKKVERLAIVVTGVDVMKIITIAKCEDGSGVDIAETVYEHIVNWSITEWIIGICTDTTATNTGCTNGSVILFQVLMEQNLLYFACRHHVFELVIGAIFIALFGETTAPSPDMFENFKSDWHKINQKSFKVSHLTDAIHLSLNTSKQSYCPFIPFWFEKHI